MKNEELKSFIDSEEGRDSIRKLWTSESPAQERFNFHEIT